MMIRRLNPNSVVRSIVAPLIVMVILTLLVGYTAYQMTQNWEHTINKMTTNLIQTQILNNIHSQLSQSNYALEQGHIEKAQQLWQEAKKEADFLSKNASPLWAPLELRVFLSRPDNIQRIPSILKEDYFKYNIEKQENSLTELQTNSRRITLLTTASMVFLGLLLISVTAFDLTRLFQELAYSRDLNTRIQEQERHRIAQELHDAVIQELIDLKRDYQSEKVDHLVESIRRICHSLKPQVLEDLGLLASLEHLAQELGESSQCLVTLNIEKENLTQIPKNYELPIFRIVQELFNNIKQHSNAETASLTLIYDPKESPLLRLYVRDSGQGFDPQTLEEEKSTRLGLTGVKERVRQLEGDFKIQSEQGKGSTFQMLIPIRKI